MSPEGREIQERVEAPSPASETDPADLGPAVALMESLPDKDHAAVYRLIELKARAYRHQASGTRTKRDSPRAEAIREKLLGEGEVLRPQSAPRPSPIPPARLMLVEALREGDELCVCDLSWIAARAHNLHALLGCLKNASEAAADKSREV